MILSFLRMMRIFFGEGFFRSSATGFGAGFGAGFGELELGELLF
tara:strand:- start:753 stop:884 length:132 start_codon:yes stop_codon:yes gene_type:complete